MTIDNKAIAANWLTAFAIGIAAVLPLWQVVTEYGWLGVALGRLSILSGRSASSGLSASCACYAGGGAGGCYSRRRSVFTQW
jgi:hypothetical protein